MLHIPCPWCGKRAESEFRFGGESHVERPEPPSVADDARWADYLFYRDNRKGMQAERWLHRFGCGRWFNMVRSSVSHEILAVYGMTDPRPDIAALEAGR
jgi:sarcosine oxidase subunit delta